MPIVRVVKASPSDEPIRRAAEALEPTMRAAFLRAVARVRDQVSLQKLSDAIARGDYNGALAVLAVDENFAAALRGKGIEPGVASFRDAVQAAFAAGAKAAIDVLPTRVAAEVAFDLMNPESVRFLNNYAFDLIKEVTKDTREAVQRVVERAFREGGHPTVQAREIKDFIGLTARQEQAVANYRAALEGGNLRAALSRGLRDGRYDRSLLKAIREGRGLDQGMIDKLVARYRERFLQYRARNVARTECLTGETLVSAAVVRAVRRRWYDGPVVKIITREGRKFSATPNHPMLTRRGWVGAGAISKFDDLICYLFGQNAVSSRDQNVERPPATLSEIFDASRDVGVATSESATYDDFHGDGREGYVDALRPDGELRIGRFSALYESTIKELFAPPDFSRASFCDFCHRLLSVDKQLCLCRGSQLRARLLQAATDRGSLYSESFGDPMLGFSREVELSDFSRRELSAVRRLSSVREEVLAGLGKRAAYSGFAQYVLNPTDVSSEDLRDGGGALPRQIELDRVVSVRLRAFSGHVFNLETPFGYFNVNGAYTGNTLRAANKGQRELWRQAVEQGLMDADAKRFWIVSGDERTCDFCSGLDGEERGLDEEFAPGIMDPPDPHPQCRCAVAIRSKFKR